MEIAKRTGGKLYDEHVDIFNRIRIKFMMQEYVLNDATITVPNLKKHLKKQEMNFQMAI